ncbi:MAG: aspartate/glutamate racemase family protein [Pseudomonadota bacterium]
MIGIIGGMSEQSTAIYYKRLNEQSRFRRGGLCQVPCILWSFDFDEIVQLQSKGEWEQLGTKLADAAQKLVAAGAECIVLATNTMHKVADVIASAIKVPFIHVADVVADAIKKAGFSKPVLLATCYTMEQDFYISHLRACGLDVRVPEESERREIHRIIFDELCKGIVKPESKKSYLAIIERMQNEGADCVILGCTEIGMLLKQDDAPLELFDTAFLHADAALDWSMMSKAA